MSDTLQCETINAERIQAGSISPGLIKRLPSGMVVSGYHSICHHYRWTVIQGFASPEMQDWYDQSERRSLSERQMDLLTGKEHDLFFDIPEQLSRVSAGLYFGHVPTPDENLVYPDAVPL